jgi:hypothetical protein
MRVRLPSSQPLGCSLQSLMEVAPTELVFVAGLPKMLGRTEAAISQGNVRGVDWLPKSFRMGNKYCCL